MVERVQVKLDQLAFAVLVLEEEQLVPTAPHRFDHVRIAPVGGSVDALDANEQRLAGRVLAEAAAARGDEHLAKVRLHLLALLGRELVPRLHLAQSSLELGLPSLEGRSHRHEDLQVQIGLLPYLQQLDRLLQQHVLALQPA